MDLKEWAKKLKTDIPAVFIALKHEKTIVLFWLVIILLIVKAVFFKK